MNQQTHPVRLIDEREVQRRTGFKHTFIWHAVKSRVFPQPIKHGRSTRFVEAEVDAWIRARIADRDGSTTTSRLLFSEREIADALGISTSFLQKDRLGAQRVPCVQIGAHWRYDIDEVRAALKARPKNDKKAEVPSEPST